MKRISNKDVRVTKTVVKKNIVGNFRGKEDKFWTMIVKGLKNFLKSPFK